MADRIFERILNQTAADVAAQQEQEDPEAQRRKAQVRIRVASCCLLQLASSWLVVSILNRELPSCLLMLRCR